MHSHRLVTVVRGASMCALRMGVSEGALHCSRSVHCFGRAVHCSDLPWLCLHCISLDQVEGKAAENYGVGFGYHDDDTFHTYFRESDRVPEEPEDDNNGEEEVRILLQTTFYAASHAGSTTPSGNTR